MELRFEGWFQCRLATNPDPTDELRGVSGYTFALAGEPDLDRVIRFKSPVAPRSHAPQVGVKVTEVMNAGAVQDDHPLTGAAVNLLHTPRFESRNVILSDDRGGVGLIHPFVIEIAGDGVIIRREDLLDPERPDLPVHQTPPVALNRRAAADLRGMKYESARVAAAVGIQNATAFRRARRLALERDRAAADDAITVAALDKRIRELSITDPNNIRTVILNAVQDHRFEINGPAEIHASQGVLRWPCDTSRPWPLEFWMGAWDADALCGFVQGKLTIHAEA